MPTSLQNLKFMLNQKLKQRTFKPYTIHRTRSGIDFEYLIADPVGKEWYDTPVSDTYDELDYAKDVMVRPGDVIIEFGAHHGYKTCYIAKLIGEKGKIVSVEPSPFNTDVIKQNVKLNHLKNVEVVTKAGGEVAGQKARFSYSSNSSIQEGSPIGTFETEITTIDSYAHLKPTMLKIDVEGYEIEVLKGAQKVLKTRPKLMLEIHTLQLSRRGFSVQDVFDLLDLSDYDATIMEEPKVIPLGDIKDIKTNVQMYAVPKKKISKKPRSS
jgi:FkbM family methyltransferase